MTAYSESHWRNKAAPIIARLLNAARGEPEKVIKARLREAYPFGVRQHHPYKIWLDEIARQRGKKPKLGTFGPRTKQIKTALIAAGQADLFR